MNIITVDWETYYSKELGFKSHTTEEYVRHDDFHEIGVGIAVGDQDATWFSGSREEIATHLRQFDWANSFVLAHNTQFDGAILSWRYGVRPKGWLDTLCMARAIHGVEAGGSLAKLALRYNIGVKGTEVENALGLKRTDFSSEHLARYGEYCRNDVELTRTLFHRFMLAGVGEGFPVKELKVIDCTLRMFVEPELELDKPLLEAHLEAVKAKKAKLLEIAKADKDTLMSNDKFAELLMSLGVEPPTKISARTGLKAWAFAKTDEDFKLLAEHADPRVQALVGARLGNKTTLEESRTQRFIDIATRGKLPVPIKYYAAHTGRWGGDDKINLQNLPSRGQNANRLKLSIKPPEGYVIIDCDSSQIEARTVAWLAGQQDLVDAFDKGEDVYKIMASAIYGKAVEAIDKEERFVGKTTILGAGYGMGAAKFQAQLKTFGTDLPLDECQRIISVFRATYDRIPALWRQGQNCLEAVITNNAAVFGVVDAVRFDPTRQGFQLPSKLWQRYEGLRKFTDAEGKVQYEYPSRKGPVKMYGGKLVENVCQAVARCVIAEQMLLIAKRYKVVLTVHDAVACIAPSTDAKEAQAYVETCMRWRPTWASALPLNCESGMGDSYGGC
jgi:DNA polymerase